MPFLWVNQQVNNELPFSIAGLVGMGSTPTPNFLDIAYQNN